MMAQTPHRPRTPREAQGVREPHTGTAVHGEPQVSEGHADAPRVAPTGWAQGGKRLGEKALRPAGIPAEETPDVQTQADFRPAQRHVGHRAPSTTQHRRGAVPTARTRG
jgi:hypothetical protein